MRKSTRKIMLFLIVSSAVALLMSPQMLVTFAALPPTIKDLGVLPGGTISIASAINDNGQVVGFSNTTTSNNQAFLWTAKDGMINLGTLPETNYSQANDINNKGQVVGHCGFTNVSSNGAKMTLPYRAFLWSSKNGMIDLGTLPGTDASVATDINNNGQIVGYTLLYRVLPNGFTTAMTFHAFLWTAEDGMKDLGALPGGNLSIASAINNKGQIIGYSNGTGFSNHAFIWTAKDGMKDIGTLPGGNLSIGRDINENGQVVGMANAPNGQQAFLWTSQEGMRGLGFLPGGNTSSASGINNNGQIVGAANTTLSINHAFIWTAKSGMVDLGTLPNGNISNAMDINNKGQVVGASNATGFLNHATLWDVKGHNP